MPARRAFDLLKKTVQAWIDDRAASMGAALSYYTVFSIAPLLLIVIGVAGAVFGADEVRAAVVTQLQGLLGEQVAEAIEALLRNVSQPGEGVLAAAIGSVVLFIGATTAFAELQDDLDRIWRAPERNKPSGVWGWVRSRLLSFGMVLTIGFLLMVSLLASTAIAGVGDWLGESLSGWQWLAQALNLALSFGLITVMFAAIYRFMPHVDVHWRDVWIGAAVTSLLFTIGKHLIGLYLGKSSVATGFGAAGSLAVLLVWVYYSAQIFLLGAEFTWIWAGERRAAPVAEGKALPEGDARVDVEERPLAPAAATSPARGGGFVATHPLSVLGAAAAAGAGAVMLGRRLAVRHRRLAST
ncbi:YihY/virulence factor BrkB family protein [Aquabacterium humicola]|uniref:YihY/virulence factor BrkB family protein n=1 Tax=Aquabacterium humicola TaxID=3237377 RepID=UPI0025434E40|nr:YihY/virulence factor BrkB family protein [Rubrivivax pictus]